MRSLIDYINRINSKYLSESYDSLRLNDVTVEYDVNPQELIIQAPNTYQETDIQLYINDMWLNRLPSGQDYSEKFFGNNFENIADAYFEYDSFEHITIEPAEYIEYEPKYDVKNKKEDQLDYFKITNLKYFINFDRFDLVDTDENHIKYTLEKIFKTAESSNINKYPIEIKFNKNSLEYRT